MLLAGSVMWPATVVAQTAAGPPLVLEAKIPLGDVSGRIDHLSVDVKRQRLFVVEPGNKQPRRGRSGTGQGAPDDRSLRRAAGSKAERGEIPEALAICRFQT